MMKKERKVCFEELVERVKSCTKCRGMVGRIPVITDYGMNLYSKDLFVAEAPGRLGADKTGIPLMGDKTGDNFEKLLKSAGLKRQQVFITNAVLCNLRNEKGNNRKPTREEMKNCSVIDLMDPGVVVTLGRKALYALK